MIIDIFPHLISERVLNYIGERGGGFAGFKPPLENGDRHERLRLMDRGEGILGLGLDIELPGDQVVEYRGIKVLNIEPELAAKVKGITLDVDDTPDGLELVLDERRRKTT